MRMLDLYRWFVDEPRLPPVLLGGRGSTTNFIASRCQAEAGASITSSQSVKFIPHALNVDTNANPEYPPTDIATDYHHG